MRKQFLLTIIAEIVLSFAIIVLFMNRVFDVKTILDATFIVGIITFFIGLIIFSNASEILKSTGYVFKTIFSSRFKSQYHNYYAYKAEKQKEKEKLAGLPILIIGGVVVTINLILSVTLYL